MNKKMFYTLSIGAFVIMLLPLSFIFFKPRYSNVFEEIYHDEYNYARVSWRSPTASTLECLPDMEKKSYKRVTIQSNRGRLQEK